MRTKPSKFRVEPDAFEDCPTMGELANALGSVGAELVFDAQGLVIRRRRKAPLPPQEESQEPWHRED